MFFRYTVLTVMYGFLPLFFLTFNNANANTNSSVAKVLFSKGDVFVISNKKKKSLTRGQSLHLGESIKTGPKSLAVLSFGKSFQSKMKIIQNSELQVTQEQFSVGQSKKRKTNIILNSGGVVINFINKKLKNRKKKNIALEVKTKNAVLGVRGTTFFAFESDKSAYLNVNSGEVAMKSNVSNNSVNVKKSKSSLLNKDGGVIKPRKMKWQKNINWKLKGEMAQPKTLFSSMRESYNAYKNEQEFLFNSYRKENKNKLKKWKSKSDNMRNRIFGH